LVNARTIALKLEFHLFKKERALLRNVPGRWQANLRRRVRAKYLVWGAREYHSWLKRRLAGRKVRYACEVEKGLLSLITPVWDGTPLKYFHLLAESVVRQNQSEATEWVIVNNGCQNRETLACLEKLEQHSWIAIQHAPSNLGIVGGLRLGLESATGRYILPVDSDDYLYPDCLQVVAWWLRHEGFPPLLYSDEDKVIAGSAVQPYLKPDFDPVLLLNSAYIAHLGVIDRKAALKHNAYADKHTEGSPDWDLFARFFVAGEKIAHIPEVIYSWRMHPESTADDAGSKPYIHSSQKAVLQRYLDASGLAVRFDVEYSPLLNGSADWWLQRRAADPWPAILVSLKTGASPAAQPLDYPPIPQLTLPAQSTLSSLFELLPGGTQTDNRLLCLVSDDLQNDRADWLWEAIGLFERYPDTAMVGGHIRDISGATRAAGYVLGFGDACRCPDRGRPAVDPGYFTQMLKQRSASAVSSQFSVIQTDFLRQLARSSPASASVPLLGAWVGALALRTGRRIIYSPYLSGVSNIDWDCLPEPAEIQEFRSRNADLMPDSRFYPSAFDMQPGKSYRLAVN
jgi:glycosyltransferase involved in cell wall biosynthesis